MIDTGLAVPWAAADRIKQLRRRSQAWAKLDWKKHPVIILIGGCRAYELVSGVFCKSGRQLIAITLPSSTNETPSLLRADLGIPVLRDFAIDPAQDLIALIEDDFS